MLGTAEERTATFRRRHGSSGTRQRIIAVSLRLFAREGFPGATMRDIAREAGISDAAIYYHFPKKDELLSEVLNSQLQPAACNMKCAQSSGSRSVVQELVQEAAGMIEANHRLLRIILRESLAGDPIAVERYDRLLAEWKSHVEGHLKPLEGACVVLPGEVTVLASQIALTTAIVFEDMLLLRPDPAVSRAGRFHLAKTLLTRQIGSLIAYQGSPEWRPVV